MPKAADSLQQSRVDDGFTPAEIRFIEALMEAPQYRWLRVFGSERDPAPISRWRFRWRVLRLPKADRRACREWMAENIPSRLALIRRRCRQRIAAELFALSVAVGG
ncbi:MAG TPA: hypothetical protein VNV39_01815 [Stellaceae bacterium]|nr:hypothetical protein [Stellaceae bacterium]